MNAAVGSDAEILLELLKKALTRYPISEGDRVQLRRLDGIDHRFWSEILRWANSRGVPPAAPGLRATGMDWPEDAETMIGLRRLDNLQKCIVDVLRNGIPGDLVETGVWRGGAAIFMRAVLEMYGDNQRRVWLADSFQGLPKPDPLTYPADKDDILWCFPELAVPLETVQDNFRRYGLLDEQVRFLRGWFRDTLPAAPVERIAVLRLDGDMYESTIVALRSLYGKVSPGGYLIVDDYGAIPSCWQAVNDFRRERRIRETAYPIDWTGIFWQIA
jgi:O-methyltransferase